MVSMVTYIAVHGGAGIHSRSSDEQIRQALRRACTESLKDLGGATAINLAAQAVSVLEDDECLNAGHGSNLTLGGTVECDAAIMDGRTADFGSVGAVSGVKYPILAALAVLKHARTPDILGRIPPLTLVSYGAHAFAASKGLQTVTPESMVCPRTHSDWQKWKQLLENGGSSPSAEAQLNMLHNIQDTVGAVTWDAQGGLAAGVSSGGLLLKSPGRVGEASVFGAGCWAQQTPELNHGMACSVSGAGEYITRCALARSIGEAFFAAGDDADTHDILYRIIINQFYEPTCARGEPHPNVGVLLLTQEREDDGTHVARLWCAFTTESMAIAYATSVNLKPKVKILRRPSQQRTGKGPSIYIASLPLGKD